jgi:F420-0:gamma-glutamyl ligase-like protein
VSGVLELRDGDLIVCPVVYSPSPVAAEAMKAAIAGSLGVNVSVVTVDCPDAPMQVLRRAVAG